MRLLPLAIAAVALSLSLGTSARACEFQKSSQVSSNSPLVERLVALDAKQGVTVRTQ